jgi:hypothetical protein
MAIDRVEHSDLDELRLHRLVELEDDLGWCRSHRRAVGRRAADELVVGRRRSGADENEQGDEYAKTRCASARACHLSPVG